MNVHETSLNFRPDIQGMRALAILLVVACHAGFPGFSGGFVGVDIFFVISGFLITGLLSRELQLAGKINLVNFYARRCKRLLPALLAVLIATLLFSRILLSPHEQIEQITGAYSVPLWLSNFHFSISELGYFAPEASSNLFLHTWSLGVEEQFYLLWPLLLMALVARKIRSNPDSNASRILPWEGLALIVVAGFVFSILVYYMAPLFAFYMMPARAWQFAAGGLVFLKLQSASGMDGAGKTRTSNPDRLASMFGPAGLLVIGLAVFILDENMGYPGVYALLPTTGAVLLLWSGASPNSTVNRWLGIGCLRWTGDISYSWYLWHWPVLLLGAAVLGPAAENLGMSILLVFISLLLAWLSFMMIEAPIRNSALVTRKPALTLVLSVMIMFSTLFPIKALEDQAISDKDDPSLAPYLRVRNDLPVIYEQGCDDWHKNSRVVACAIGDETAERKAVLIGDSIGVQWFSALAPRFVDAGWQFIVYTKSACPIVDQPYFYPILGRIYENCAIWRDDLLELMSAIAPDVIFIGSSTGYGFSVEQWMTGTANVLERLAQHTPEVFLLMGTMALPFNGPACLERRAWQPHFLREMNTCSANSERPVDSEVKAGLKSAVAAYPNTVLLDFNPLVCPQNICAAESNGQAVYRDEAHLADLFVESLTEPVFELIREGLGDRESLLRSLWTREAPESLP